MVLCGVLGIAGCAAARVSTMQNPDASLEDYGTFSFMEGGATAVNPSGVNSPEAIEEIREAIRAELVAKGFAEGADPDFQIAFNAAVDQQFDVNTFVEYYNYRWRTFRVEEQEVTEYREGSVVIDIVDADSNELAWRGVGESSVGDLRNPNRRQATIARAVREILADFPPAG